MTKKLVDVQNRILKYFDEVEDHDDFDKISPSIKDLTKYVYDIYDPTYLQIQSVRRAVRNLKNKYNILKTWRKSIKGERKSGFKTQYRRSDDYDYGYVIHNKWKPTWETKVYHVRWSEKVEEYLHQNNF